MFGYNHKKEASYQLLTLISNHALYAQEEGAGQHYKDHNREWYGYKNFAGRTEYYVTELVHRGADINCRDGLGNTPLLLAIAGRDSDTAQMLVTRFKADVNAANKYGETPLMLALSLGQADVAQTLLLAGAKTDAKNQKQETAADIAAQSKVQAILDLVPYLNGQTKLDGIRALREQQEKDRMLFRAAGQGMAKEVDQAVDRGANPNAVDAKGMTPLMVVYGNEAADALVAKGAKLDTRDNEGKTALMHAAMQGKPHRVEALLKAGADPSVTDNTGKNAADYANDRQSADLIEDEILKRGGNTPALVAARDKKRATRKLFEALSQGELLDVPELLMAGADPYAANPRGQNALTLSIGYQHTSVTAVLLAAGLDVNKADANGETPLYAAYKANRARTFNALLKNGASPEVTAADGESLLHTAISRGADNFTRMLIENKADITKPNKKGETPLAAAVYVGGQSETIKALAKAGVNLNEQDADGNTLLIKSLRDGRGQTSMALIEAGADVTLKNAKGETALDFCSKHGDSYYNEIKKRADAARDKRIAELEAQVRQLGGDVTKPGTATPVAPPAAKPAKPGKKP